MADAIVDPFAAALLAPSCGALAQTLRNPSGITTGDATAQGARLAAEHQDVGPTAPASTFLPRLRDNLHMLLKAHRYIARQNQRGLHVGDAGNWLIENI